MTQPWKPSDDAAPDKHPNLFSYALWALGIVAIIVGCVWGCE